MTDIATHADRLAAIAASKRAHLPRLHGRSTLAVKQREADLRSLEFAHRVLTVAARAPEGFERWFEANARVKL